MKAVRVAQRALADFFVIECLCPEEVIKGRLHTRISDQDEASDGRWEIFQAQKVDFDEITEISEKNHLIIDTSLKPEECAKRTIWQIKGKGDGGIPATKSSAPFGFSPDGGEAVSSSGSGGLPFLSSQDWQSS